jgi:Uma2 family endonuclease
MLETISQKIHSEQQSDNKISWEDFQERFLIREDEYKYEWVNGEVQITTRDTHKTQFHILRNLNRLLYTLYPVQKSFGEFIAEGDNFFSGNHRRPDIAFYTDEQIQLGLDNKENTPNFVIEVISNNDQMNLVHQKMQDYYAADVKIVWHILPLVQQVHIYHGKKMEVKQGSEICSAEGVIEGFTISVDDLLG